MVSPNNMLHKSRRVTKVTPSWVRKNPSGEARAPVVVRARDTLALLKRASVDETLNIRVSDEIGGRNTPRNLWEQFISPALYVKAAYLGESEKGYGVSIEVRAITDDEAKAAGLSEDAAANSQAYIAEISRLEQEAALQCDGRCNPVVDPIDQSIKFKEPGKMNVTNAATKETYQVRQTALIHFESGDTLQSVPCALVVRDDTGKITGTEHMDPAAVTPGSIVTVTSRLYGYTPSGDRNGGIKPALVSVLVYNLAPASAVVGGTEGFSDGVFEDVPADL